MKYFRWLFILIILTACSLKGEDVIEQRKKLDRKRNRYEFDKDYILKSKKLKEKNPRSLVAHSTYISARSGSKIMLAEYKKFHEEVKSTFSQYLLIKAELTLLNYRQQGKKKELVDKLVSLAKENESIRDEAYYDLLLNQYYLRDKKVRKEFANYLVGKYPKKMAYEVMLVSTLEEGDGLKALEFCKKGLRENELGLCSQLDLAKGDKVLNVERDKLFKQFVEKVVRDWDESRFPMVYSILNSLIEEGEESLKSVKEEFVSSVLKRDPKWIPYKGYKIYYGDIDYKDFELLLKLGKLNKIIDFKERILKLDDFLKVDGLDEKGKANVYSNMGYAYLNPANLDKEKAFKFFIKSNEIEPLGSYGLSNLLSLVVELKKDEELGLMLIEDRMEKLLNSYEKTGLGQAISSEEFLETMSSELSTLYFFQGKLLKRSGKLEKARFSLLKSMQYKATEEAAYLIADLYQEKNPLLSLDFLSLSYKNKSEETPLDSAVKVKRDNLFKSLHKKYYTGKLSVEELLKEYEGVKKKEEEIHPFVGKALVSEKILDFRGGEYEWEKLKGKNVILSFWATWCTPCFQEMAVLNKIHKEGRVKDLRIVGVCTDGISQKKKVQKILKEGDIDFDILLDDGTFRDKYLVSAIPSMFFLNKEGNFIKQKTGYSPKLEEEIFKIFR